MTTRNPEFSKKTIQRQAQERQFRRDARLKMSAEGDQGESSYRTPSKGKGISQPAPLPGLTPFKLAMKEQLEAHDVTPSYKGTTQKEFVKVPYEEFDGVNQASYTLWLEGLASNVIMPLLAEKMNEVSKNNAKVDLGNGGELEELTPAYAYNIQRQYISVNAITRPVLEVADQKRAALVTALAGRDAIKTLSRRHV